MTDAHPLVTLPFEVDFCHHHDCTTTCAPYAKSKTWKLQPKRSQLSKKLLFYMAYLNPAGFGIQEKN